MAPQVKFAVYGALRGGDKDSAEAAIVTARLQQLLNDPHRHGVVQINNENMGGDPAKNVKKHFGAIVTVDGVDLPFACLENQSIDFT
jgi:hypothetical protein